MRLLTIAACPCPWPRGTPIRIHRMAEALVERGHEVHVATYPLGDERVHVPYRVHRVSSRGSRMDPRPGPSLKKLLWLDPMLLRKVIQLLRTRRFDVIHAHHYEGLIVALLARRVAGGTPILFDSHTLLGTELSHYPLPFPDVLTARLGSALDRALPARADHVVAVTARMRDWFESAASIPAHRLSLIPNGVEYDYFQAGAHARSPTPSRDDTRTVLFAGNLAQYQGIPLLLEAFARLHELKPLTRLQLVTESSLDPWRRRIAELGIAHAVEAVSSDYAELPGRLRSADVLVNPRTNCDGIPQKLLNYMASGRPIVSFEGSAAVLEHERTGLVVPDGDVGAFALAMQQILDAPERGSALGNAARDHVAVSHSWQHAAEQMEGACRSCVGTGEGRS